MKTRQNAAPENCLTSKQLRTTVLLWRSPNAGESGDGTSQLSFSSSVR
ncbi:hypothetical protein RISK_003031 [Rhodopirellula islandica]|uniref:Uncharacterized protein n=1 Tax=Rhodopirellula islandica TaxID=595434 RepID=A0A0J1BDR7_RHOIS|nr:hypothetical protein RISK_003031 [Rhodopirellula islandica]